MPARMSFETKAKLGYAILALLLAAGMAYSVRRLSSVAAGQAEMFRAEEQEITLVERLRWISELIVSSGRGYLLSGDPEIFTQVHATRGRFHENVRALRSQTPSPRELELVVEVERAAQRFIDVQEQLLTARQRSEDIERLMRRFDAELLPLGRELDRTLDRLVDHKAAGLQDVYDRARAERVRIELWLYGLLAFLVLAGLGVAWYFANLLGRSYRQEQDALEAARKALATRDEVMGIVAHDLRNPLGAISMRAAMLQRDASPEKVRHQAESIQNVVMRMEYLIRTMLDVTMMEAGRFSVVTAACDVEGLVREVMELFTPLAGSKQVRLELRVGEPGLVVHADRERVLQVLSNLVGNALKFTPQGGQVTLAVDRQPGEVRFAVHDTGPGIAREHLPHVFERFWKSETTGKKGTGLGLFIARSIVDAHAGRIWAESEPGSGARFCFTLPLDLRAGPAAPGPQA
jgi:signal transduction histidine kinase